jgi:hypothetical protein
VTLLTATMLTWAVAVYTTSQGIEMGFNEMLGEIFMARYIVGADKTSRLKALCIGTSKCQKCGKLASWF